MTKRDLLEIIENISMDAKIEKVIVKDKKLYAYRVLKVVADEANNTITIY